MFTEVTAGIKVTVETFFQPTHSNPTQHHYVFAYRITIFNKTLPFYFSETNRAE